MSNLSVKIGKLSFKNPITVASGTFAHAEKYYALEEVKRLGSIIPKTVTLYAQEGNPPPRIVETPSGMLNAIGIENPGVDVFIKEKLPKLKKIGVPLIVSILGHGDDQFLKIIDQINPYVHTGSNTKDVCALELNLSCPNLRHKTLVAQDAKAISRLIRKVKKRSKVPIFAKLTPNVTDIRPMVRAAEDAGADGVSLINTLTAMVIDVEKRTSALGNFTGGLSGPAIRPVAVHMVHQAYKTVKIPIIASGGVMTAQDALQFIIAGASLVAVGTANFINPRAPLDVLDGIEVYMKRHKIKTIKELHGSLKQG
ncbi:MAG: dihydroorotate dehydrogenase [Candidatus Omnitrophica bacterium]|nr:dihydroorotate dehydrogenase [Candidatus Omnitrophota bacterium]